MHFNQAYDPFRALGSAWQLVRSMPLTLLVGGALLAITDSPAHLLDGHRFSIDIDTEGARVLMPATFALFALGLLLALALFLFSSLIRLGLAGSVQRALCGEREEFGELFQARGGYAAMVLVRLLVAAVWIAASMPFAFLAALGALGDRALEMNGLGWLFAVGGALLYLPFWAYFVLGVSLASEAVACEQMQPVEALARSWNLVRGHRVVLLLYLVVTAIAGVLGVLACCVGFFASYAWMQVGWYDSYLRLVHEGEPATWHPKPVDATAPGA